MFLKSSNIFIVYFFLFAKLEFPSYSFLFLLFFVWELNFWFFENHFPALPYLSKIKWLLLSVCLYHIFFCKLCHRLTILIYFNFILGSIQSSFAFWKSSSPRITNTLILFSFEFCGMFLTLLWNIHINFVKFEFKYKIASSSSLISKGGQMRLAKQWQDFKSFMQYFGRLHNWIWMILHMLRYKSKATS